MREITSGLTICQASHAKVMVCMPPSASDLVSRLMHGASPMQVDTVAGMAANHLHKRQADGEGVKPRPRMVRVGKELASLSVRLAPGFEPRVASCRRICKHKQTLIFPASQVCHISLWDGLS